MILGPYYKEGLLKLLIIFGVITTIGCHLGICVLRDPNSSAYYDCIMGLGYQNSTFLIQPTANQTQINSAITMLTRIKNARLGATIGLNFNISDVNIDDIKKVIQRIPRILYDVMWVMPYLDVYPDQYEPITNPKLDCLRFTQIIQYINKKGIPFAITTGTKRWSQFFGDDCNVDYFSKFPLYWIPRYFNSVQSFDDFIPFAGWHRPEAKIHRNLSMICGNPSFPFYFV